MCIRRRSRLLTGPGRRGSSGAVRAPAGARSRPRRRESPRRAAARGRSPRPGLSTGAYEEPVRSSEAVRRTTEKKEFLIRMQGPGLGSRGGGAWGVRVCLCLHMQPLQRGDVRPGFVLVRSYSCTCRCGESSPAPAGGVRVNAPMGGGGRDAAGGGEGPRRGHCQFPSFTILAFSMMNFPSLYFWLSSNAWRYFHPSTCWQQLQ